MKGEFEVREQDLGEIMKRLGHNGISPHGPDCY
jgi:hypothetical protein